MKCSRCHTSNREVARFCQACGNPMPDLVRCAACSQWTPASGASCDQCGEANLPVGIQARPRPLPNLPRSLAPRSAEEITPARTFRFRAPRSEEAREHTQEIDLAAAYRGGATLSDDGVSIHDALPPAARDDPRTDEEEARTGESQPGSTDDRSFAALEALLHDVQENPRMQGVAITGEAGVGKTYRLRQFLRSLGDDVRVFGADLLAMPASRALPLLLAELRAAQGDATLRLPETTPTRLRQAAEAAAGSVDDQGRLAAGEDGQRQSVALAFAALGFACSASAQGPVVVALGRQEVRHPFFAAASAMSRANATHAPPAGALLVVDEHRSPTDASTTVAVPALDDDEVLALVRALSRLGPPSTWCETEILRGKHLPREVLWQMSALGPRARERHAPEGGVPHRTGALRILLRDMAPVVRSVLGRAALLGECFSVSVLIALCDEVAGREGVQAALSTLVLQGLLDLDPPGAEAARSWIRFADDTVLAAARDLLPSLQAEALAGRVHDLLEANHESATKPSPSSGGDENTTPDLRDVGHLADLALERGASFAQAGRIDEARAAFERAMGLSESARDLAGCVLAEVRLAELELGAGERERARTHAAAAVELAPWVCEATAELSAGACQVRVYIALGELETATQALRALSTSPPGGVDDRILDEVRKLEAELEIARKAEAFLAS